MMKIRQLRLVCGAAFYAGLIIMVNQAPAATAGKALSASDKSPRVLFLGDEVMFAYEIKLRALLGDRVECSFVRMPQGRPNWDVFFDDQVNAGGEWDIIHFSYGRELMRHEGGKPLVAAGEIWEVYYELYQQLAKTDALLVACTTTPLRGQLDEYQPDVDWNYASRFKQMVGPNGVKLNDLGDYTRTRMAEMVHDKSYLPTELGVQLMAEQVANSIFEALNEKQDPDRPRILIVGDSIVGGYYSATRDLFANEAIVYSGGTTYNDATPDWKKIVDEYIAKGGEQGWDVIQFNWGLHAVKHVDAENKTVNADHTAARVQFPPEPYMRNLERFVQELKRTGAVLVFATTTPIPENTPGSIIHTDLSVYNDPAKALMAKHGIVVNDLYAFAFPQLEKIQIPQNVHFTSAGSAQLAKQNYEVIAPLVVKK